VEISLTFKTPDAVDFAIEDLEDYEVEEVRAAAEKWIEYGEYITVVLDTKKGTCEVQPV